jgi:prepilin-type N-terminal cleavage/methylation domain-containing protein
VVPLPTFRSVRRGVTLLELLIVLTLMGVAAALVAPALVRPAAAPMSASREIVSLARKQAIRRGEPLRVTMWADGAWTLATQRDGALVDSGRAQDSLLRADLLLDALGTCVPAEGRDRRAFDLLSCGAVDASGNP